MVAVLAGTALGVATVREDAAIADRHDTLTRLGWGLIRMSSSSGDQIDPAACALAADVPGAEAVGAVGPSVETRAVGLEAGLSITPVDPAILPIVWPEGRPSSTAAAWLTPGMARLTGIDGGILNVRVGPRPVPVDVSTINADGRYPALEGGLLLPTAAPHDTAYCLVQADGEQAEAVALDTAAATASYGTLAVPVVSALEASPTPAEMIDAHRRRLLPGLAGLFLLVLGSMRVVRSRRDRAVYRLLGFGRADLWTMGLVDYLVVLGTPAVSAFALVVLARDGAVGTVVLGDAALFTATSAAASLLYATLWSMGRNTHQFAPGA